MQKLGIICSTAHSGELIIRVDNPPRLNQLVHDRRKKNIGKIVHIFGNVNSPYTLVKPFGKMDLLQMVGREIYVR